MMTGSQQREVVLTHTDGFLDLFGYNEVDGIEFSLKALGAGTDWGNPESVRRVLRSAIANGSLSVTDRYDNRTIPLRVKVEASDGVALAAGERALMLASGRRAELTWTPPADMAAPCVFVVVNSDLKFEFNHKRDHIERVYILTLEALPHTRSAEPVVIEALAEFVGTPATLEDCTSTVGWSSTSPAISFSTTAGLVKINSSVDATTVQVKLTKTLARAKRYLAIESDNIAGSITWTSPVIVTTTSGTSTPALAGVEGKWRFYDLPSALGSVLSIEVSVYTGASATFGSAAVHVLTIAEADSPALTSGRQSLRVIPTPGSAPADGSLTVSARNATDVGAGTALEQVIVYTGPQYDPRLSVGRAAGTTDAAALSGKQSTGTDHAFDRWARDFPPGSYSIWVSAKGAAGAVDWSLNIDATNPYNLAVIRDLGTYTASSTLVGTGYNLLHLGAVDLPGFAVTPDSIISLRFLLTSSASTSVDEVLVFNRSTGSLTIIDARNVTGVVESPPGTYTTTAGASRVWLDTASVDSDGGVIAGRGTRAGSLPSSLATELKAWSGSHLFTPDATYLYVGTTGALDPVVTGEFRPAWHTHPVE